MLFPCIASTALAHADASFGFPEIRRGVLPGVVSVAARRRLSAAVCRRLMCTGDTIDAQTARRLGLVDFVGSWSEIEAELRTEPRVEQRVAPRLQSAGVVQAGAETAAKAVAKPKDEGQPKAANKKDRYDNGR